MKQVAIMTWYSYRNYGTVLQAVALNRCIASLGYMAKDVSYDPELGQAVHHAHVSVAKRALLKAQRLFFGGDQAAVEGREDLYRSFIDEHLPLTPPIENDRDFASLNGAYDCFVCGSDQIWSPRCFDPRYYLDFVEDDSSKIAYAPSFGCDSLDGYDSREQIASLLRRFASISVREESGVGIVKSCTGHEASLVLDPTLLLSADDWHGLACDKAVPPEPYCLFYFLGQYAPNRRAAERVAAARGLRVIDVPIFQRDMQRSDVATLPIGPAEFIALLESADCICTDSFHGMAFASVFNKDLVAFERFHPRSRESQNTRVYSFLEMSGMSDALLRRADLDVWRDHVESRIDYRQVIPRIASSRKRSLGFLETSLSRATVTSVGGR